MSHHSPTKNKSGLRAALASAILATFCVALPTVASGSTGKNIEIVVDSSGSMDEYGDNGQRRIDTAKSALSSVIGTLSDADQVALRVYGTSDTCSDGGQLEVPLQPLNRAALQSATDNLAPRGNTPTPAAISSAIRDLSRSGGSRQIVLMSDGESTCGDPCYELRNALYRGINVVVHTVGFYVTQSAEQQLACMAAVSGGRYFPAPSSDGLAEALEDASQATSRFSAGTGASLIQLLVNAYAHEDWQLVRSLNPARRSMSAYELQKGWGGMEEAWVFPIRERKRGRITEVDSLYVTNEVVGAALAEKKGLQEGSYITQSFCITWSVDLARRTVQERPPRWSTSESGYLNPQFVAQRAGSC
jgi:von Willebrand factor type A domain